MSEPFPGGIVSPQDFLNGIMPMVPNTPIDLVKHSLLTTARDFCQFGRVWRDWIGPINLDPTTPSYSIELTHYKAELVATLEAYVVSTELALLPAYPQNMYTKLLTLRETTPRYFNQTPEGLVNIFPMIPVGTTEQVMLFVTMKPIDLCFPSWITSKHYDALCNGVLERIYSMKGPSHDTTEAMKMGRRYRAQRAQAGILAGTGGVNIHEQVVPPLFAHGTGIRCRNTGYSTASRGYFWGGYV